MSSPLVITNEKAAPRTYGLYEPAPLIPATAPDRSRLPRLFKWTVGICIFLRISFIFGLFFQDRQHDPVSCLDPEFLAQCTSLLIPTHSTYTDRLSRLVSALKVADGADPAIWIAEPGPSTSYFLGAFASSDWHMSERPFLIGIRPATDGTTPHITLLTPEFERLRAQLKQIPESVNKYVEWVSWQESESPYEVFIEHTGKQGGAVMDPMVRSFIVNGLLDAANETHYGETRITDSPYSDVEKAVALIRERKDEREVGLLRCANQMTLHAIRKLRSKMHIGITESQTRAILEKEMVKTGLTGGSGLILFGENAALPHGSGTDRVLGKKDMVLIDAGGEWGGYVADITRTFALPGSKIPKSHHEIWETVRQAQYAPYELLKSSNISNPPALGELDIAARNVITSYMPDASHSGPEPDFSVFTHRLGHGIGLEGHEGPYLVQGPLGEKKVQSGNVFSLEPGVYLPADGPERNGVKGVGARLEDCFVVTEDEQGNLGGEWLSGPVKKWGDV